RHYRQDFRCRRADGEIRWLHEEVRIEAVGTGRWRLAGVFTEITGRKRVEEALRASEARYRALVENFPNGCVFLLDRDLRFLAAGGTDLLQAGLSPEEMEGKTIFEVLPEESSASAEPLYRKVVEGQEVEME